MENNNLKQPRFRIEAGTRVTKIMRRQKYYLKIISNHNGQTIVSSEKYTDRDHVSEMAHALKDELQNAPLTFKF